MTALAVLLARQRRRVLAGQGVLRDDRRANHQDLVGDGDDYLRGGLRLRSVAEPDHQRFQVSRQAIHWRSGPRSGAAPLVPTVNSEAPTSVSRGPTSAGPGPAPPRTPVEISISAGSRPTSAQCCRRMPTLRSSVSASPKLCQMSACRATSRSVFRSPPPPMSTGIFRVGGGFSLANRDSIRGSAAA